MTFEWSTTPSVRRQQKAFVDKGLALAPAHIQTLIRSVPCKVVFKAFPSRRGKCIYYQGVIYLPQNYWKDQWRLAKWMKQENRAFFLHECFHAVDMLHLTTEERDSLLLPLTGYETNAHKEYSTGPFPLHVSNGEQLAQWFHDDFAQSAAELFADTGVEAFTTHRFTRAATALQVTETGKNALRQLFSPEVS